MVPWIWRGHGGSRTRKYSCSFENTANYPTAGKSWTDRRTSALKRQAWRTRASNKRLLYSARFTSVEFRRFFQACAVDAVGMRCWEDASRRHRLISTKPAGTLTRIAVS
jgi:hypothetical protein